MANELSKNNSCLFPTPSPQKKRGGEKTKEREEAINRTLVLQTNQMLEITRSASLWPTQACEV